MLNAEYQTSAYWVIPDDEVLTWTTKEGFVAVGNWLRICGASGIPKKEGSPMPVLGAGVNWVIEASS